MVKMKINTTLLRSGLCEGPHLDIDEGNFINGGEALDGVNACSLDVQLHIADLRACMPHDKQVKT